MVSVPQILPDEVVKQMIAQFEQQLLKEAAI